MQPPPYVQSTGVPATGFAGTNQSAGSSSGYIQVNSDYSRSWTGGILKIMEMILCLIVIICNNINLPWQVLGGGWVNFVVIIAIFGSAFSFYLHLHELPSKMVHAASYRLAEFILYVIWDAFWLIAGIVAAARAGQFAGSDAGPPVAACAFFCFAALVVYVADTYFVGVEWRTGGVLSGPSGPAPFNNFPGAEQPSAVTVGPPAPMVTSGGDSNTLPSAYTTFASPSVLGDSKPVY